jgi:hypothetical protein
VLLEVEGEGVRADGLVGDVVQPLQVRVLQGLLNCMMTKAISVRHLMKIFLLPNLPCHLLSSQKLIEESSIKSISSGSVLLLLVCRKQRCSSGKVLSLHIVVQVVVNCRRLQIKVGKDLFLI